jgi:hypothetical protein
MPELVNISVGSLPGTSGLEATTVWPLDAKKSRKIWRMSATVRRRDRVVKLQRHVQAIGRRPQAARQAGPALALGIDGGAGDGRRKQGREQAPRSSTFCGRGH